MSPESVDSQPVGPEGDLWALGCIAYQMLSGQNAMQGGSQYMMNMYWPPPHPNQYILTEYNITDKQQILRIQDKSLAILCAHDDLKDDKDIALAAVKKHRDIKLSNMLLTKNNGQGHYIIKLADFGLATKVNGTVDGESNANGNTDQEEEEEEDLAKCNIVCTIW